MERKLYRSEADRMVAGVCGGLAEYLDTDPTLIRIITLVLILGGGSGLLAYFIGWIVIPTKSSINSNSDDVLKENTQEIKDTVTKTAKGLKTEVKSDTSKEESNGK